MNINTGKLFSNSSNFQKKIKEIDSESKILSKEKILKEKGLLGNKLIEDFSDIKFSNQDFKSRIIENNKRLVNYENELSKLQFIEQKVTEIEENILKNNNEAVLDIINNSKYNNEYILKEFFTSLKNIDIELSKVKKYIENKNLELTKEFKSIEISSQNILSLKENKLINYDDLKNALLEQNNFSDISFINNNKILELIY